MFAIPRGFTIDSGAAEHVIPTGWVNSVEVKPSPGSVRGVQYVAATGAKIKNMGQQLIPFWTNDGVGVSWLFQVAGVNKPLVSVAKLVEDGWKITFDQELSFLHHKKTGKVVKLRKERGVYVVDAYMIMNPSTTHEAARVLIRQGM